jgi:ribosomal protein S18 acetylase RimI-like enzyme
VATSPLYRNLSSDDASAVFQLGHAVFTWPSEGVLWNEELVRWYCAHAPECSFVATSGKRIVGIVLSHLQGQSGYVAWIAVATGWRKKGVGRELLQRSMSAIWSAGVLATTAFVREDGAADHLFSGCGFRSTHLRKIDMIAGAGQRTAK